MATQGLFAIGQAAFYGIGAYTSALVTKDWVTQWSGSQVGALAGALGIEVGFILAVAAINYLDIGHRRDRLHEKLMEVISPFEASVLTTTATILVVGASSSSSAAAAAGWCARASWPSPPQC